MPLNAEATHIYKPGNKDEVRLVYRVRSGGESNRHQKSFSIGKYGIDECWRMARESKNFINATHRLPHDFLDPWASLKNLSSVGPPRLSASSQHQQFPVSHYVETFLHSSLDPLLNHSILFNQCHEAAPSIDRGCSDIPFIPLTEFSKLKTSNEHSSLKRGKKQQCSSTFKKLESSKRCKTVLERCEASSAMATRSQTKSYDSSVNGYRGPNSKRATALFPPESPNCTSNRQFQSDFPYLTWPENTGSQVAPFKARNGASGGCLTDEANNPVLYMQLKKKRGRPPKWLRTFSPNELQQMFKYERDTSSLDCENADSVETNEILNATDTVDTESLDTIPPQTEAEPCPFKRLETNKLHCQHSNELPLSELAISGDTPSNCIGREENNAVDGINNCEHFSPSKGEAEWSIKSDQKLALELKDSKKSRLKMQNFSTSIYALKTPSNIVIRGNADSNKWRNYRNSIKWKHNEKKGCRSVKRKFMASSIKGFNNTNSTIPSRNILAHISQVSINTLHSHARDINALLATAKADWCSTKAVFDDLHGHSEESCIA